MALKETFKAIDDDLESEEGIKELEEIRNCQVGRSHAGCAALVCLLIDSKIYVANAGDCRCLLFNTEGVIYSMNREHKPNMKDEKFRIINSGGFVMEGRVNQCLNLSRALGDLEYKQNKD